MRKEDFAPVFPSYARTIDVPVIGLVENDVFPVGCPQPGHFRIVINQDIAMDQGFVLGRDHAGDEIRSKVPLDPFILLRKAMVVLVQG